MYRCDKKRRQACTLEVGIAVYRQVDRLQVVDGAVDGIRPFRPDMRSDNETILCRR